MSYSTTPQTPTSQYVSIGQDGARGHLSSPTVPQLQSVEVSAQSQLARQQAGSCDEENEVDVICPLVSGFFIGYLFWILAFFLWCQGEKDGKRTFALRRGAIYGIIAITVATIFTFAAFFVLIRVV